MTAANAAVLAYRETQNTVVREYPLRLAVTAGVAWIFADTGAAGLALLWWVVMAALLGLEALAYALAFSRERESVPAPLAALFAFISFACAAVYTLPVWALIQQGASFYYFAAATFMAGTMLHLTVHNSNTHLIYFSAVTPMTLTFITAGVLLSRESGSLVPLLTAGLVVASMATAYFGRIKNIRQINEAMAVALKEREAAREASAAKSAFLAKMSHELRTPLNAMLGLAQVLRDGEPDPARAAHAETILKAGDELLAMLGSVLDYSKLDAGRILIDPQAEDLVRVVESLAAGYRAAASEKGVRLEVECADVAEPQLRIDGPRLRQCLGELIANAVKFTEKGSVRVTVRSRRIAYSRAQVEIEIADTGIGMSAEECARVFAPFEQADNSPTRRFGGAGLGLTISRGLVEAMGGELSARSKKGVGTTISVRFAADIMPKAAAPGEVGAPSAPAPQAALVPAAGPSGVPDRTAAARGARILLVEDNIVNRQVVRALLSPLNLEVVEAENGAEALRRLDEGGAFDVVLMDLHMPVMDGLAATRAIRTSSAPWSRIPVVALTAAASAEDRAASFAAGVNDFLSKPIKAAVLAEAIARFVSGKGEHAPAAG